MTMSGEVLPGQVGVSLPEVVLQNPQRYHQLESESLRKWLIALLSELAPSVDSFVVRFLGDQQMRELNRTYRGRDRSTDVLTFPGEATSDGSHLGDVVICVPTARFQAANAGIPLHREIQELILHGVLHCLGYDHERDDGEMNRLELQLRQRWTGHGE